MCIAAIAFEAHPRWRLVIAANRDEYHERPSAPLARWDTDETGQGTIRHPADAGACGTDFAQTPRGPIPEPDEPTSSGSAIIAGRDLRSGGTWLGASEPLSGPNGAPGRCALVTNYRLPGFPQPGRPSRGGLVTAVLKGADPAAIPIAPYNPFNLFVADAQGAWLLSNGPEERRQRVVPGVLGLSNGDFARPWPKTRQLCAALEAWLGSEPASPEVLFAALATETPLAAPDASAWAEDGDVPEPCLAPVFIRNAHYGTRCSTLVLIDREGAGRIVERRFSPEAAITGETEIAFRWL